MNETSRTARARKPGGRRRHLLTSALVAVAAIIAVLTLVVAIWVATPYPADTVAIEALSGSPAVEVSSNGDVIFFRPAEPSGGGLVFYPGGRVDVRAYAPLALRVAQHGHTVALVRMPLSLAVLDAGAASRIIDSEPDVTVWAVGGHSLGGAMAARFAREHPSDIVGLVLLAAYPASSDDLTDTGIPVLSMRGTADGLVDAAEIDESRLRLPSDTRFVLVPGGNHAGFGSYGAQRGDGTAALPQSAQQAAAAYEIARLLDAGIR